MKRLWIALALMIAVFCAIMFNGHYLGKFTRELTGLLTQAEAQAEAGRWEEAGELTQAASRLWDEQDFYLHVMLRHSDTDQIYTLFQEVREFLQYQKQGEYSAANARLITLLDLLYGAEQLTLKNVL